MNNVLTTIAIFLIASIACLAQETTTLKVTIPNASNDEGKMLIAVYTEDTFMKAAPVYAAQVTISKGVATYTFENVLPGVYAVNVVHDKNDNGRIDFDGRMPSEAYGMSNNPMTMGPPTWGEAKFTLKESTELTIRL